MWRYLFSAIVASVATFLAWSILVDGNTLDDSTTMILVVALGTVVALIELVVSYFWSLRSAATLSSVYLSISRNPRLSGMLYGTGFMAGAILTLIACILYDHISIWAHAISLVAFLVVWWVFDFYVRTSLRKNFAEQGAGADR